MKTAFIVPASLCRNWIVENEKFNVVPNLTWWIPAKAKGFPVDSFVCSYEAFRKLTSSVLSRFRLFVFDECHKLKSPTSKRTEHVASVVNKLKPRITFLSGTPFTTSIADAYSLYSILDSASYNQLSREREFRSYASFKDNFMEVESVRDVRTRSGRMVKVSQYSGFINTERFFELTSEFTFKKELDLNLPELNHQILAITAERVSKDVDKQLAEMATQLGKDVSNFQTARKLSAMAKSKAFADILSEYQEVSGSIIGFSCYPEVLEVTKSLLLKRKLTVEILGAKTSVDNRSLLAKKFQEGKIDVLLCSLLVAREGFTLTKANTVVFNDISPVSTDNEQASKRIHRIGQTSNCRVIYLARSEIDSRLTELCTEKQTFLSQVDRGF